MGSFHVVYQRYIAVNCRADTVGDQAHRRFSPTAIDGSLAYAISGKRGKQIKT